MSAWNRRPVSSVLLLALLGCATAVAAPAPSVRLSAAAVGDRGLQELLRDDAAWLSSLPTGTTVMSAEAREDSLPGWLADPTRPDGESRRPAASPNRR